MTRTNITKRFAVVLTSVLAIFSATLLIAPAGFSNVWKSPFVRADYEPILAVEQPTANPGTTTACYVNTGSTVAPLTAGLKHKVAAMDGQQYIHIYSDPIGAASYDGAIDGSTATVPVAIAPNAPTGTIKLYLQTQSGAVASDTVTITN